MDYNQFTYYRANPYARQGYIPPIAHTNRHKPNFLTQMPMGEQHLTKIGKKFFTGGKHQSNIQAEHLLESPERYPFENRIALDKNYQRNLNTIDIEGASSGTLLTQGVRNKLKAREALIRRQKEESGKEFLAHLELTQEQKRRQVAYHQYMKNEMRNSRMTVNENREQTKSNQIQQNDHSQKNYLSDRNGIAPQKEDHIDKHTESSLVQRESPIDQIPRYQSIDVGRPHYNPEEATRNSPQPEVPMRRSKLQQPKLPLPKDRYEHRLQNPTYLSYESQISRAGRNLLNN